MVEKRELMTVGFLLSKDFQQVLLIRKTHPPWQKGLLNGIGGHFEEGDRTFGNTIRREFQEETGVSIENWLSFGELYSKDWFIELFCAIAPLDVLEQAVENSKDMEEKVEIVSVFSIKDCIPNVRWLVPAAIDFINNPKSFNRISVRYKR